MPDADLGKWFSVINPRLKTFGLQGPCRGVNRNRHQWVWDTLLIEFGSGARRWIRRQNLRPVYLEASHA